ncbi:MAG: hypothetical protein HYU34_03430 [Candidatus Omnitrophica bacterium]|nr:hypothetical protein [Candidatus Omnitrophota bacterium]
MNPARISTKELRSFYKSGFSIPLIRSFQSPLNPWELYKRGSAGSQDSFFLDSLEYRPPSQSYSYLGFHPTQKVLFEADRLRLEGEINRVQRNPDLLLELRRLLSAVKTPPGFSCDFFTGGAVGYWGYELAREFDRISFRKKKDPPSPDQTGFPLTGPFERPKKK